MMAGFCVLGLGFVQPAAAEPTSLKVGGAGTTLKSIGLLATAFEQANPGTTVTVLTSLGSTGGIKAVLAGAIAIGVISRPLSEAERGLGLDAIEYAQVPLVFAVTAATRADAVTTAELIDIYTGKLKAWPSGEAIRVIIRPAGDTNTKTLAGLSPEMAAALAVAEKRPGMLFALTDQDALDQLQKTPGALAITALSEVFDGKAELKALKLNGVQPGAASLADETYPLSLPLSLVTGKASGALARRFVDFVLSEPGGRILLDTGHRLPARKP